jgi:hypothetical protein
MLGLMQRFVMAANKIPAIGAGPNTDRRGDKKIPPLVGPIFYGKLPIKTIMASVELC